MQQRYYTLMFLFYYFLFRSSEFFSPSFFHLYYRILYPLDSFLLASSLHLFPFYFLCVLFSIFHNLCFTFSFSFPEYSFLLLQSFASFASFQSSVFLSPYLSYNSNIFLFFSCNLYSFFLSLFSILLSLSSLLCSFLLLHPLYSYLLPPSSISSSNIRCMFLSSSPIL